MSSTRARRALHGERHAWRAGVGKAGQCTRSDRHVAALRARDPAAAAFRAVSRISRNVQWLAERSSSARSKRCPGLRDPHFIQVLEEHGRIPELVQQALDEPPLQEQFNQLLATHKVTLEEIYTEEHQRPLQMLAEGLLEYEQGFAMWRFLHVQLVERIIGPNTGGTGGTLGLEVPTEDGLPAVLP